LWWILPVGPKWEKERKKERKKETLKDVRNFRYVDKYS
jgi:hypothetical protein